MQPAIKSQITTSNRELSSSVTVSNNAKANGKQQNNRHCPHFNNNHFLATCSDYQRQSPRDRYKIVIKNKLCTNCLSNNHLRQNCSSQKNCQSCNGRHHSTLHEPSKQVKRPPAAFSTGSAPFSPTQHSSNEVPPSQNKQQQCRYGQFFGKTKEPNTQRSNLDSPSNNQSFCVNKTLSPPRDWLEQLQLMPVSFVNGNKAFDTYALIDHGSQFTFLLDTITNFLALPCEAQTSTTPQYVNTQNEMPLSKITAPVIITPYKSLRQSFEISRAYSTPAMNVTPANIFELNQLCDTFNNLRHIHFPQVAGGKIGALLGVNTFAYTHPIEVIPGNINQPFGVKTKLGWTLAGEYETSLNRSESTFNHHSTTTKQFIYHVSRQQTEEPRLSELVEQFWKIESEGTPQNCSVLSDEDNDALKVFRKTIRHNSERYEIGFPWKTPCLLENNFYCALNQLKCLEKRLGNNPTLKEKYDQTLSTDLIKNYIKPVEMAEPEPEKICTFLIILFKIRTNREKFDGWQMPLQSIEDSH